VMKYRKLDSVGDYVFGSQNAFWVDAPEAVRQAVDTRLNLWQGEWFLDSEDGTPYLQDILGFSARGSADLAIQDRILGTPGVSEILDYSSQIDSVLRSLSVQSTIKTQYGEAELSQTI
jgi:hypothetical protein